MVVGNVTLDDLQDALDKTNEMFDGNIAFTGVSALNQAHTRWRLRLTVLSSRLSGARLSAPRRKIFAGRASAVYGDYRQRRISAACWHVYGVFVDRLPSGAVAITTRNGYSRRKPGDPWEDFNAGSVMEPAYMSELCECPYGYGQ